MLPEVLRIKYINSKFMNDMFDYNTLFQNLYNFNSISVLDFLVIPAASDRNPPTDWPNNNTLVSDENNA